MTELVCAVCQLLGAPPPIVAQSMRDSPLPYTICFQGDRSSHGLCLSAFGTESASTTAPSVDRGATEPHTDPLSSDSSAKAAGDWFRKPQQRITRQMPDEAAERLNRISNFCKGEISQRNLDRSCHPSLMPEYVDHARYHTSIPGTTDCCPNSMNRSRATLPEPPESEDPVDEGSSPPRSVLPSQPEEFLLPTRYHVLQRQGTVSKETEIDAAALNPTPASPEQPSTDDAQPGGFTPSEVERLHLHLSPEIVNHVLNPDEQHRSASKFVAKSQAHSPLAARRARPLSPPREPRQPVSHRFTSQPGGWFQRQKPTGQEGTSESWFQQTVPGPSLETIANEGCKDELTQGSAESTPVQSQMDISDAVVTDTSLSEVLTDEHFEYYYSESVGEVEPADTGELEAAKEVIEKQKNELKAMRERIERDEGRMRVELQRAIETAAQDARRLAEEEANVEQAWKEAQEEADAMRQQRDAKKKLEEEKKKQAEADLRQRQAEDAQRRQEERAWQIAQEHITDAMTEFYYQQALDDSPLREDSESKSSGGWFTNGVAGAGAEKEITSDATGNIQTADGWFGHEDSVESVEGFAEAADNSTSPTEECRKEEPNSESVIDAPNNTKSQPWFRGVAGVESQDIDEDNCPLTLPEDEDITRWKGLFEKKSAAWEAAKSGNTKQLLHTLHTNPAVANDITSNGNH